MCLCGLRLRLPTFLSATSPPASPSSRSAATRKLPSVRGVSRPRHKALHKRHCKREWADGLLFSNLVYALAGLVSLSCGQYFCALFQFGAAVASTAFHRSKETKYLLVDASISSTLAIVFVYFAMHVLKNEWYGILAIKLTQGFMCVFTWLYCGLPGGERYELWHQRWHYVSGFTTITTTLLLAMYMPDFDIIMHELIQDYVIVTKWLQ